MDNKKLGIRKEILELWLQEDIRKSDFIIGVDPASGKDYIGAKVILRTEKKVRWKSNDILTGPHGLKFIIKDVSRWTWLHRILSLSKYYNARLTLMAKE